MELRLSTAVTRLSRLLDAGNAQKTRNFAQPKVLACEEVSGGLDSNE